MLWLLLKTEYWADDPRDVAVPNLELLHLYDNFSDKPVPVFSVPRPNLEEFAATAPTRGSENGRSKDRRFIALRSSTQCRYLVELCAMAEHPPVVCLKSGSEVNVREFS